MDIGIDSQIVLFIAAGVIILLVAWIIRLEVKLNRMRVGSDARTLDDTVKNIKNALVDLYTFKEKTDERLRTTEQKVRGSIRRVETKRFNPFKGTGSGGNQSFASAFITEDGDGVVISSLYARDRMSVFSKPLSQFSSEHELSEEERDVIERARKQLSR